MINVLLFSLVMLLLINPRASFAYTLEIGLERLADQIVSEVGRSSKEVVVITDFTDLSGNVTEIGIFLSQELVNKIGKRRRMILVERRDLKRVLEELELHVSGVVDKKSAKELGVLLGADIICTGTVIELFKYFKLNLRLIDTETGKIVGVAGIMIDKDELEIFKRRKIQAGIPQGGNLIKNGGFGEGYSGWKREIGDINRGASQVEIIAFPHSKSGKGLHIRHKGEGYIQFHQAIMVSGPDLFFSASFQASSREGGIRAFSGTGIVQIGLQYFSGSGEKLGETILINYMKNIFADTPLIGVPRRNSDTYKTHYIELAKDKFHSEYSFDIRKEVENNLLGIEPESIRQMAIILWCGASHPQAGSELWITDISLKVK